MKRIFISFTLLLLIPCYSQWVDISPDSAIGLRDVSNPSDENIIVVGGAGVILKSVDGGITWSLKESGTESFLQKIEFISPEVGFILGMDGTLLKTIDMGETWETIDTGYNNSYDFSIFDENNIYILGFQNFIHTSDGGETWELISNSPPSHTYVQFFEGGVGYIGKYKLYKTIDDGDNWSEMYSPNLEEYDGSPFGFINENIGFTYWHGLTKFKNNEQLWLGSSLDFPELLDLFIVDENRMWGIIKGLSDFEPPSRGIVKINVIGESTSSYSDEVMWKPEEYINFRSIKAFNDVVYVVGDYGVHNNDLVWKNVTGENYMNTSEVKSNTTPIIYPNPASGQLNIKFNSFGTSKTKVELIDFMGRIIHSEEFSNQLNIMINISNYPKGIYIVKIKSKDRIHSQKIIIE